MKKTMSLVFVFVLYCFAAVCAALTVWGLGFLFDNLLLRFFVADIVATIIIWLMGLIFKNSSLYDPYWSVQPIVLILGWLYFADWQITASAAIIMLAVGFWAIRLTANWIIGWSGLSDEDWRYKNYRSNLKKPLFHLVNFVGIHTIPTLIVFFVCIPLFYIINQSGQSISVWTVLGASLCLFAAGLQLAADAQMRIFRAVNTDKTKVMDKGLWKYSRHPNYLGEILMWWGVTIAAAAFAPWWVVFAPIANTLLFLFVSIPLMEKRLGARPSYAHYKKTVSMLLLLPPRKLVSDENIEQASEQDQIDGQQNDAD